MQIYKSAFLQYNQRAHPIFNHNSAAMSNATADELVASVVSSRWFRVSINAYIARVGSTKGVYDLIQDIAPKLVTFLARPSGASIDAATVRKLCYNPHELPLTRTEAAVVQLLWASWARPPTPGPVQTDQARIRALRAAMTKTELNRTQWTWDVEALHRMYTRAAAANNATAEQATEACWRELLTRLPRLPAPDGVQWSGESVYVDRRPMHGAADNRCWYMSAAMRRCTAAAHGCWCATHGGAFKAKRGKAACAGECNSVRPTAPSDCQFCPTCKATQQARYAAYTARVSPAAPRKRRMAVTERPRKRQKSITDYVKPSSTTPPLPEDPEAFSSTTGPAATP